MPHFMITCSLIPYVTGEITFFPNRGSNPVRWTQSSTLYHVACIARQYKCVIYLYLVTFSPFQLEILPWIYRSENYIKWDARSFMHTCGLFTVGAKCNSWKNSNHLCCSQASNPGHLRDRPTLYRLTIKAGLYARQCKCVINRYLVTYITIY